MLQTAGGAADAVSIHVDGAGPIDASPPSVGTSSRELDRRARGVRASTASVRTRRHAVRGAVSSGMCSVPPSQRGLDVKPS
jgi:hypothetical protein